MNKLVARTSLFSSQLFYYSDASKGQKMEIKKVHTMPGFSFELLNKEKIKDAAVLELKKDAKLSPQVKTRQCISFQVLPLCLPSAASEGSSDFRSSNDYQEKVQFQSNRNTFVFMVHIIESIPGGSIETTKDCGCEARIK